LSTKRKPINVLLIEDQKSVAAVAISGFIDNGFLFEHHMDGLAGLNAALSNRFDVIVLDLTLPNMDGLDILIELKRKKIDSAVIILTARHEIETRLAIFELGAADYLSKPFYKEELCARIKASHFRSSGKSVDTLEANGVSLNLLSREVTFNDRTFALSQREFLLLDFLMRSPDEIFNRQTIISHVWKYDFDPSTNIVEVCIQRLRKKLNVDDKGPQTTLPIESVRGVGYCFKSAR
jgi:hypothetical protein